MVYQLLGVRSGPPKYCWDLGKGTILISSALAVEIEADCETVRFSTIWFGFLQKKNKDKFCEITFCNLCMLYM